MTDSLGRPSRSDIYREAFRLEDRVKELEHDLAAAHADNQKLSDALVAARAEAVRLRELVLGAFLEGFHNGWEDYRCEENNGPVLGFDGAWEESKAKAELEGKP